MNVYEYENGQLNPISHVAGEDNSFFLDAGADGRDVFIATAGQLLPEYSGSTWPCMTHGLMAASRSPHRFRRALTKAPADPRPRPTAEFPVLAQRDVLRPWKPDLSSPTPPSKAKTAAQVRAERLAKALKACRKDKNRKRRQACERVAYRTYGAKGGAKKSSTARRANTSRRAPR